MDKNGENQEDLRIVQIKTKLNDLAEIDLDIEKTRLEKLHLLDNILTPEQRQQLNEINDEFRPREKAMQDGRSALEDEIKDGTGRLGQSVSGEIFQAVYSPDGKTSTDMKMITELAKTNPAIRKAFSQGDPYVVIKRIPAKKTA